MLTVARKIIKPLINDVRKFLLQVTGKKEILVLGDSHALVFNQSIIKNKFAANYFFTLISVGGATASGLENPNSVTQAYEVFLEALQRSKPSRVIIMLGEVDTGFVIWYRANKYGAEISLMLDKAVKAYTNFIKEIALHHKVIVISTPLPTIPDGDQQGVVANARKDIKASQVERTNLTLNFNRKIASFCYKQGVDFLSLDEASIGQDGLVKVELLNNSKCDHHYEQIVYAKMISEHLQVFI